MGGSCKGCKYSGRRHSGSQVNCNLNECIYADALYDIRKACELIADIFKRYDDECFKAAGVKIINKITEKNTDKGEGEKTKMKVRRQIEMKVDFFKIGDQIEVKLPGEKHMATAIKRMKNGMLFLLDDYLNEAVAMNENGSTEGGWDQSGARTHLQKMAEQLPAKLKKRIVPFENGDLLTILSLREMFGLDENFNKTDGQIEWMKDRRHRIALRKGVDYEWGWLRSVVSGSNFAFVNYDGGANHSGASYSLGIRPAFVLNQ